MKVRMQLVKRFMNTERLVKMLSSLSFVKVDVIKNIKFIVYFRK